VAAVSGGAAGVVASVVAGVVSAVVAAVVAWGAACDKVDAADWRTAALSPALANLLYLPSMPTNWP